MASKLLRFTAAERWIHRWTAAFMLVCIATSLALYNPQIATMVGSRYTVVLIHLYSGFLMPVPMIVGLLSRAFRKDLRLLNRFASYDRAWLRRRGRSVGDLPVGKFNAGQKLNSAFTAGSVFVMLGTGIVMYYPHVARLPWRTGATFVHDMLALAIGIVVLGHIYLAANDAEARHGMKRGTVSRSWAQLHHSKWAQRASAQRASAESQDQLS